MSDSIPFLYLKQPCDEAIAWFSQQVKKVGLQVMCTFDLQMARINHGDCPCPHHGTEQCDCQMVVLLVYGEGLQPVSLIAHSFEGKTWFSLVDTAQQQADPRMEAIIFQSVFQEWTAPFNQTKWIHPI